jgi:hypothetical protein
VLSFKDVARGRAVFFLFVVPPKQGGELLVTHISIWDWFGKGWEREKQTSTTQRETKKGAKTKNKKSARAAPQDAIKTINI